MIYDRTHTRNMDDLSGMRSALPWLVIPFIIGGLVSMGMPGLSGFIAEFPIFMGVWQGTSIDLNAVFSLNPANYYNWVAILSVLAIIITAAYILRAVGKVFFGDYEGDKWHDMRPLLAIDKFTLMIFSGDFNFNRCPTNGHRTNGRVRRNTGCGTFAGGTTDSYRDEFSANGRS